MSPNILGSMPLLAETAEKDKNADLLRQRSVEKKKNKEVQTSATKTNKIFESDLVWRNIILFIFLHTGASYGLYLLFTQAKLTTAIFTVALGTFAGTGITVGAHRLWAHKAYKAKWPLRLILMIANLVAFEDAIWFWVRDHRVHHKFTDTDADPYNSKRGFFFSHMGWLVLKKHPMVAEKGKTIDMSDIEQDPIVMFQKKYYIPLMVIFCFVLPTTIPMYLWDESLICAFYVCGLFRYCLGLHFTWMVNSVAHIWGMKPYEKGITPVESKLVAFVALGEGWHNYHHVFPWDYKTAELGDYGLNFSTAFIDFFAKIGWAYDLKTTSEEMIRKRVLRSGDGTHKYNNESNLQEELKDNLDNHVHNDEENIWGWDDPSFKKEDKDDVKVINPQVS